MKHIKLWLTTMAVLLCSVTASAATYSDWTSTNKGQSSSTSSNTYNITANTGDVITFDWLVSSESGYDKLIVTLNGSEILNKSGEQSGTYQHTFTSSGSYTMVVKYTKDGSVNNGSDYAKVYNVTLSTENSGNSDSENIIASGSCGDNLTWELNKEGELTIEGTGAMTDYTFDSAPWYNYKESIKSVIIKEGVTSISSNTFDYYNLTSITIPSSVIELGNGFAAGAFDYCYYTADIYIESIEWWLNYGAEGIARNNDQITYLYIGGELLTDLEISSLVKSIPDRAFLNCRAIASVTLEDGITEIGLRAFYGCRNLTSIDIPESVLKIGAYAFGYCSNLTSITIPRGVATMGSYAFSGCSSLSSITSYAGIPPTGGNAYFNNVDKSIPLYVPATSISAYQTAEEWKDFTNIQPLVSYIASGTCGDNLTWKLTDDGELTIEGEGQMTGSPWWYDYATLIKRVIIEEEVTSIVSSAFYGCSNLCSIVFPESVISVGAWAFEGCSKLVDVSVGSIEWWINYGANSVLDYLAGNVNLFVGEELLTEIEIPSTIASIPSGAFRNCTNVVSVSIPESISTIGQGAFDNTGWYTNQPDGVLYISDWLYGYKGEIPEDFELVVKEGTRGIVDYAFEGCSNLIRVTIPESTQYIGDAAFMSSGLILATMSEGVNRIGGGAFWGCRSLTDVAIPESVTEVGNEAFAETAWCRKQPCGVLYLSGWAVGLKNCGDCENCEQMNYDAVYVLDGTKGLAGGFNSWSSVVIPESVVYLNKAFASMNGGGYIVCKSTVPPCNVDSKTFERVKNSSTLYVPTNSVTAYAADEYWGEFANIKAIDFPIWSLTAEGELIIDGVGPMDNYEPEHTPWHIFRSSIHSVTIKEGITSVGDNAFALCEELASVSLPNSLELIGEGAFAECDKLKSVEIPENVTSIGSGAFISAGLSSITCKSIAPPVVADWATFHSVSKSIPLYVPLHSVSAYNDADYWNEFTNVQAVPSTLTISQYGSGTYCSPYALDFSEVEGLKAYAATGYNTRTGVVTLTRVMTAKAGEGLFIKGEPGDYMVPVMEDTDDNTLNMLLGTLTNTDLNGTSTDGLYTNYKYTIKVGDAEPMFYQFDDGSTLAAERAYLQIPTKWLPQTESKAIRLRFVNGATTNIEEIESTENGEQSTAIYDLMGRHVENPSKGCVYIVNGCKVIY